MKIKVKNQDLNRTWRGFAISSTLRLHVIWDSSTQLLPFVFFANVSGIVSTDLYC